MLHQTEDQAVEFGRPREVELHQLVKMVHTL